MTEARIRFRLADDGSLSLVDMMPQFGRELWLACWMVGSATFTQQYKLESGSAWMRGLRAGRAQTDHA